MPVAGLLSRRLPCPSRTPVTCQIIAVNPNSGTGDGGDTVRITCSRIRSGATVTIGGNSATITASSYGLNGFVDVTTPAHAAGAVDVVVTDPTHGTDTLTGGFEYTSGGSLPSEVVFHSAFMTGTGTGDAALRDTGLAVPWDHADTGTRLEVVAASTSPALAPFTRCVRQLLNQPTPTVTAQFVGPVQDGAQTPKWSAPTVANPILTFRHYFCFAANFNAGFPAAGNWFHPWESNLTESKALHINLFPIDGDTFALAWRLGTTGIPAPHGIWTYGGPRNNPGALLKRRWYRIEAQLERLSESGGTYGVGEFKLHAGLWLVNAVDPTQETVIATDANFVGHNSASVTLDESPNLPWLNPFDVDGWYLDSASGTGASYQPTTATEYNWLGPVLIRTGDWAGQFSAAAEEA